METPKKDRHMNPEIAEISEKHLKNIPGGETVPEMPATGGKQFVNDEDAENEGAEKKSAGLKPPHTGHD